MSNQPAITIENAPRDAAALATIAPFQLRLLVTKLGHLATPEMQQAWHQLTSKEARADYVLKLLKDHDAKSGGTNGVNGAAHHAAPAAVPTSIPAVSPTAMATVGAAAAPAQSKTKRTPMVPQAGAPAAASGPATAGSVDLGAAVLAKLDELAQAVHTLNQNVAALTQHVNAREGKNAETFQELQQNITKLTNLQAWTLTTMLLVGENQLGAAPVEILGSAVQDAGALDELIAQVQGKA